MADNDHDKNKPRDQNSFLEQRPSLSSPGVHAVRGLSINFVSQSLKLLLALVSTVVLTRLLMPADFGLVAMVTIVVGLISTFRDAGLGMATVQKEDLTHAQVSSLFWINITFSLALAILLAASAPLIANFFDEPRLVGITFCLALGLVIGGAGVQHTAILQRNMQFKSLALAQISALSCGLTIAIFMAMEGFGYWALVSNILVSVFLDTVMCWLLCKWRPSRPAWDPGLTTTLRFGGALSGFNFLNYFSRNGDNLLIGWRWGSDSLGLYSRAYELIMLPIRHINAPLASVAIPLLSRLQHDQPSFQRMYCRFVNLVAWLTIPLVSYLCVNSEHVVALLWGDAWSMAAPILQVLALAALGQSVLNSTGWIYIARARTDVMLKAGAVSTALIIAAFVIGLPHGTLGVAIAYAIISNLLILPLLYIACRATKVSFSALLMATKVPAMICAAASALAYWLDTVTQGMTPITELVLSMVAYAGVFAASYITWPACRSETKLVLAEIKDRFS